MQVRYSTQPINQPAQQQQPQQQYATGPTTHTIQIATAGTTGTSGTSNTYTHTQFVRSAATGGAIQLQTVAGGQGQGQQVQGHAVGQQQMRMVPAGSGGNYRRVGSTHLTGYQVQAGQQGQGVPRGPHQGKNFDTLLGKRLRFFQRLVSMRIMSPINSLNDRSG